MLDLHFPGIPAEIIFLSPKVNNATVPGVEEASAMMQSFFESRRGHFQFRTIINEGFKNIVLDDVTPLQKHVADTSELFLRAAQLLACSTTALKFPRRRPALHQKSTPRTGGQTLPIDLCLTWKSSNSLLPVEGGRDS